MRGLPFRFVRNNQDVICPSAGLDARDSINRVTHQHRDFSPCCWSPPHPCEPCGPDGKEADFDGSLCNSKFSIQYMHWISRTSEPHCPTQAGTQITRSAGLKCSGRYWTRTIFGILGRNIKDCSGRRTIRRTRRNGGNDRRRSGNGCGYLADPAGSDQSGNSADDKGRGLKSGQAPSVHQALTSLPKSSASGE
jgi:hypothetical protein